MFCLINGLEINASLNLGHDINTNLGEFHEALISYNKVIWIIAMRTDLVYALWKFIYFF